MVRKFVLENAEKQLSEMKGLREDKPSLKKVVKTRLPFSGVKLKKFSRNPTRRITLRHGGIRKSKRLNILGGLSKFQKSIKKLKRK